MFTWKVVEDVYDNISVSKTTVKRLDAVKVWMGIDKHRFTAPKVSMENATIYTTYVKGKPLGLVTLQWSGAMVPPAAKAKVSWVWLKNMVLRVVCIEADRVAVSALCMTAPVPAIPPTVVTLDATDITTSSARLNACFKLGTRPSVDVWFEYDGKSTQPVTYKVSGTHSEIVTGLSPGTTYRFRAILPYKRTNIYGKWLSFTTLA